MGVILCVCICVQGPGTGSEGGPREAAPPAAHAAVVHSGAEGGAGRGTFLDPASQCTQGDKHTSKQLRKHGRVYALLQGVLIKQVLFIEQINISVFLCVFSGMHEL